MEDHEFPLINISILIRTGGYLEPAGMTGLAQLTGSQMRAGGTKSKTPETFDEDAAFLAAQIGSSVSDVSGEASLNCLSKDIDAGMALFVDMLRNPGFDEARLKLAKSQMLQAIERRNDSTTSIERREFQRLMRGDKHFTARPVTKASLEAISRQDLIGFHDRYYYPANFVIAVSGDFDTKQMLAKLEKALTGWPNRDAVIPDPPRSEFTPEPGVYVVSKKDVNQGRVQMGHLGVAYLEPRSSRAGSDERHSGWRRFHVAHPGAGSKRGRPGLLGAIFRLSLGHTLRRACSPWAFGQRVRAWRRPSPIVIEEMKRAQDTRGWRG